MIDAYERIKPLLVFNSEDDFYFLQIIQRHKENPQLGSHGRLVRNYYINNIDYLERRYEEIKKLCNFFNARAMLRLNKRSYRKTAFRSLQKIADVMSNEDYKYVSKSYISACGRGNVQKVKRWIIDIDEKNPSLVGEIKDYINTLMPVYAWDNNKIIAELPTKNGYHLITIPFNVEDFKKKYKDVEVHKDNPVNLYIP